jgi:hypothetical protein
LPGPPALSITDNSLMGNSVKRMWEWFEFFVVGVEKVN